MEQENGLVHQKQELSVASKTSLQASRKRIAIDLHLTALNSKSEPQSELTDEFMRVFEHEPVLAIRWAFWRWREQSPFFPAISEIRELVAEWHREQAEVARLHERLQERVREQEARASGQLVDPAEVRRQLLEIAKRMPEAAPGRTRTVTLRKVTPPVAFTPEQIAERRFAERAECERVRKQMEEGHGTE